MQYNYNLSQMQQMNRFSQNPLLFQQQMSHNMQFKQHPSYLQQKQHHQQQFPGQPQVKTSIFEKVEKDGKEHEYSEEYIQERIEFIKKLKE